MTIGIRIKTIFEVQKLTVMVKEGGEEEVQRGENRTGI